MYLRDFVVGVLQKGMVWSMDYKEEILKLLEKIDNQRFLKMIYGFIKGLIE